jgi:hypothetical protein
MVRVEAAYRVSRLNQVDHRMISLREPIRQIDRDEQSEQTDYMASLHVRWTMRNHPATGGMASKGGLPFLSSACGGTRGTVPQGTAEAPPS